MDFYTADTHFGDASILKYYVNRPFLTIQDLEKAFVNNWYNLCINDTDRIFVLGDIGESNIWRDLPGTKILIKGNHDNYHYQHYLRHGFDEAYDYQIIKDSFLILSHEPLYVNESMPYVNIFGHIHDNPNYKTFSSRGACVCACRHNFTLISEEDIMNAIKEENK